MNTQNQEMVKEVNELLTKLRQNIIELERQMAIPDQGIDSEKYFNLVGQMSWTAEKMEKLAEV